MRQFSVPQFIDVEDKIFGPLTLKQFVYLLGGVAALFILYVFLPFVFVILLGFPIAGFAFLLAFYKVNNQPFIKVVGNALSFYIGSRLYIWKRGSISEPEVASKKIAAPTLEVPKITKGKLKDLAWSLDVKERIK